MCRLDCFRAGIGLEKEQSVLVTSKKTRQGSSWTRWVIAGGVALAFAALVVEYGFSREVLSPTYLHVCQIMAAVMLLGVKVFLSATTRGAWRRMWLDGVLLGLLGLACYLVPRGLGSQAARASVCWGAFQVYLLAVGGVHIARFSIAAAGSGRAPTRALLGSFVAIILVGAILLMLPGAHRNEPLSFTDAVFTSTSATCVTGLIVRDTGSDFTRLGQGIILGMIQIGGLGIMMFGALFALLTSSRLSLRESIAMQDIMSEQGSGRVGRIVVFVCLFTVIIEILGLLGLHGMWQGGAHRPGQWFNSVFHAVSAFCNAGFSLQAESLMAYRQSLRVYLIIAPLIIIGGLGFPVLDNLFAVAAGRWKNRGYRVHRRDANIVRVSLHSKIVLTTSAILLVLGTLAMGLLESVNSGPLGEERGAWVWLDSFFNAITARTAGFNTIEISQLSGASKLVLVLLMSIGGSPGSTAGGIKTVTLAVMVLTVYATIRHREQIEAFRRRLPIFIVRRAATLMLLYGLLLWLVTLLLTVTERCGGYDLLDLLFEAASALGTVGLSTGVTGHLTLGGKWVIIVAMFIGRLGPLSLLAALAASARPARCEYPRESLVVG